MTLEEISRRLNKPSEQFNVRSDGRIEWMCEHGIGHPVFIPEKQKEYGTIHGCDGCCNGVPVIISKTGE